jgi:hypothetical protein
MEAAVAPSREIRSDAHHAGRSLGSIDGSQND